MNKYLSGIDNGGTVTKAAIYDLEGKEIGVFGSISEANTPKPGYYERDPEAVWQSNINAISKDIRKTAIDPCEILAVSLTGYGESINLVDEDGQPVYISVRDTDTRAANLLLEWQENGIADKQDELTFLTPYNASSGLLLAWMKQNEESVLKKAKWWFTVKDYIRFRLTGNPTQEITNLANSGLMNLREPGNDSILYELQGIEDCRRLVPPLVKSSEIAGYINGEATSQTLLAEGTPVAA